MAATKHVEMEYLGSSELELAFISDDVRGMVVVDPNGHRLGEVEDLVVDLPERRARLLSVVSGGVVGLDPSERLIPVESVTKVDDRVHVGGPHGKLGALAGQTVTRKGADPTASQLLSATLRSVEAAYHHFEVVPCWVTDRGQVYFHART